MKLKEILINVPHSGEYDPEIDILKLCFHSGECEEGSLFFAMRGKNDDGSNYASDAVVAGAVAIVTESPVSVCVTQIIVPDIRSALSKAASNFYYNAHESLTIVGVTGTNGKTTTCKMLSGILRGAGKSVAVFGTLGVTINDREIPSALTTPDPIELHRLFQIARLAGVEYVIMEVSAHAIALEKLYGVRVEVAAFTNFSQDHLDYFGSMENYGGVKKSFFTPYNARFAVVNTDDALGREIVRTTELPTATYGLKNPADTFALDASYARTTKCIVNCFDDIFEMDMPFVGEFNLYNALCAVTIARLLSVEVADIRDAFIHMPEVEGRFNVLESAKRVIVDFAHTPDGLKNLLEAARGLTTGRLIVVFGCGGNRDRKKRAVMGKIAAEFADFSVLTSDNSRFEEPADIIREIEEGHKTVNNNYISITDRESAITYAVITARPEDIVVVAGKGAEPYMDEKGVKRPYSDRRTVTEVFRRYNL